MLTVGPGHKWLFVLLNFYTSRPCGSIVTQGKFKGWV